MRRSWLSLEGFYRALAESPAATSAELATRTGTTERYVREWLEQQAVAGFLTVDDPDADPTARRYMLPEASRRATTKRSSTLPRRWGSQLFLERHRPLLDRDGLRD